MSALIWTQVVSHLNQLLVELYSAPQGRTSTDVLQHMHAHVEIVQKWQGIDGWELQSSVAAEPCAIRHPMADNW